MGCTVLCEHCTAVCCKYVAIPLDKPRNARDYDDIRWYLMHEGILVFVEEGDWFIQFATRCKNLMPDNRCGVYLHRPVICREYEPGDCDYAGGDYGYDHLFTHPQQVEDYYFHKTGRRLPSLEAQGGRRREAGLKARRPKGKKVRSGNPAAAKIAVNFNLGGNGAANRPK